MGKNKCITVFNRIPRSTRVSCSTVSASPDTFTLEIVTVVYSDILFTETTGFFTGGNTYFSIPVESIRYSSINFAFTCTSVYESPSAIWLQYLINDIDIPRTVISYNIISAYRVCPRISYPDSSGAVIGTELRGVQYYITTELTPEQQKRCPRCSPSDDVRDVSAVRLPAGPPQLQEVVRCREQRPLRTGSFLPS